MDIYKKSKTKACKGHVHIRYTFLISFSAKSPTQTSPFTIHCASTYTEIFIFQNNWSKHREASSVSVYHLKALCYNTIFIIYPVTYNAINQFNNVTSKHVCPSEIPSSQKIWDLQLRQQFYSQIFSLRHKRCLIKFKFMLKQVYPPFLYGNLVHSCGL